MDIDTEKDKAIAYNKKLCEEYPFLKPHGCDDWGDYDYSWTMLDLVCIGWKEPFLECCKKIKDHLIEQNVPLTEFSFSYITEENGFLTVSTWVGDKYILDLLEQLELDVALYCPSCGKPTTMSVGDYYVCEECAKKSKIPSRPLTVDDIPYYTYYGTDENGKEKSWRVDSLNKEKFILQWTGDRQKTGD